MSAIDFFDFLCSCTDQYPQSSTSTKFGGGYSFASYPSGPDQVIFILHFAAMRYFVNSDGTMDTTTSPRINMQVLKNLYEANRLHKTFIYNHPIRGYVFCKFESPLQCPKVIPDANGVTEAFDVRLIMQP